MTNKPLQIKDIGEQGLLKIIQQYCPANIIGDDAAVIDTLPSKQLVITTDVLVENVHFGDRTTPPFSVGWRAATANLSDLAAMGATPLGITVGLSLPRKTEVNWVTELYRGMKECLDKYNTPILGGDVCRSQIVTLSITAIGQVKPNRVIKRNTAKPDDVIVMTGFHGLSKAGLELLLNPELGINLDVQSKQKLILAHQQPNPRLDVIKILDQINKNNEIITGMDSSDGLADAIIQICQSSGVGAQIQQDNLNCAAEIIKFTSPQETLEWTLFGGEDFELILSMPLDLANLLIKNFKNQAQIIGKITQNKAIKLISKNSDTSDFCLTQKQLFKHF